MPLPERLNHLRYQRYLTSRDVGTNKVNEEGRKLCKWCEKVIEPPRRTWCGDDCVNEFMVRTGGGMARSMVFERDRGVCALCGIDCHRLEDAVEGRLPHFSRWASTTEEVDEIIELLKQYREDLLSVDEIKAKNPWIERVVRGQHYWEADHIVPVAEGGGCCGLEGLRTLCRGCHAKESGKLRKRLNRKKKPVEQLRMDGFEEQQ